METSSLHKVRGPVEVVTAKVVQVTLQLVVEQIAKIVQRTAAGRSFSSLVACPVTPVIVPESAPADVRLAQLLCIAGSTRR